LDPNPPVDPQRFLRAQELFADAMERPVEERAAFVANRCGGDGALRSEVESLLRVAQGAEAFFGDLRERIDAGDAESTAESAEGIRAELEAAIGARYRMESLLARGGMGLVFLAVDLKHGRRVAIKTIHPRGDADLGPRFQREIRITAGLQHPNILPLLDSGVAGRILFYIMPYLDRLGRLPPLEAVGIGIAVADALAHAHGRGILHRDVKPSNILLADNQVQVVDFGIARGFAEPGSDDLTATGLAVGTPRYMAPERFSGSSTPRSDVFALGVVLHEAITGRPGSGRTGDGEAGDGLVPVDLEAVLAKALEERPDARWQSAADFGRALTEWHRLHAHPAAAAPTRAGGNWLGRLRRMLPSRGHGSEVPKSVAVLPFGNLSRDAETEYFSDGVTEDIIAHLSRIHELKVISRTSVMRYRDTRVPIPRIGRELRVGHVLEGSVRRTGNRVRVVSQLVDVDSDAPVWSETFDRELTDIFDIQSEIAQRIARALRARITDTERSILRRRPTADVEAHDLYLKGRYLWNRRTQSALEEADREFQQAVTRDPLFAPAYAGLADVNLLLGGYGFRNELESLHRARAAVDRALQLDDDLAEAHASRGQILRAERDWSGEERAYHRAIEINPNYATAHQWYSTLLIALGRREEALTEIAKAVELDPLSHAIAVTSGIVHFLAGDYPGAEAELDRTVELAPHFFSAYAWRLLLWSHLGAHDRALEAWESLSAYHPNPVLAWSSKAYVFAAAGDRERALDVLEREGKHGVDTGWVGLIWAWLGDKDKAFRLLEQALDDPSWRLFVLQRTLLLYIQLGPWFDPLRGDPRFLGLLQRMRMDDLSPVEPASAGSG
jgi:TolB-like protein/Tfp pilus assembly protein PilF